jgi:hypothetical protein
MDERSDQIRSEIEETRGDMGETVAALSYKANVPQRTKDWVADKKETVTSKVSGVAPDRGAVKQRAARIKDTAERNPFGLAIAGAAAGFLAGILTPSTRVEDERLGPVADDVKSAAAEAGQEALERGKQVAQEAAQSAAETAKERGREEGQELSSNLREKAADAVPGAQQGSGSL